MAIGDDDKLEGKFDTLKGKAKKVIGEITDRPDLKAEGTVDKLKGAFKEIKGDVKRNLSDEVDET
jgi:uncharacterized protein YjbJ (UPF0337 family)